MILSGDLPPGARLVESSLATECGVSRTPVREALKRLLDGNLVIADPLRGLIVRTPEPAEVEDVYVVREVLDGLAAHLAAQRVTSADLAQFRFLGQSMSDGVRDGRVDIVVGANIAFHDLLYKVAGNRTLARIGKDLSDYVRRFSAEAFTSGGRVEVVLVEHQRILDQLECGDADGAERAARDHLRQARENLALATVRAAVDAVAAGTAVRLPGR